MRNWIDLVEGKASDPKLSEACWWVTRYISGSMHDPDWEDDWCTMGINEAMEIVAQAVGNKHSVGHPLHRFITVTPEELERIKRTKVLSPHPEFSFQSFSQHSVAEAFEIGHDIHPVFPSGHVCVVVTVMPSPSQVMFGIEDLKNTPGDPHDAYLQLDLWHHQGEVFVRCTGAIAVTEIHEQPESLYEAEDLWSPTAIVKRVRDRWVEETGQTPHEINRGQCFEFADALEAEAPTVFQSVEIGNIFRYGGKYNDDPEGFDEALIAKHWPGTRPYPGLTWDQMFGEVGLDWPGIHGWAYCAKTDMCYDIEHPEGVRNPFDLSFFQGYRDRYFAKQPKGT